MEHRAIVTCGINPARNFGPYLDRFDRSFRRAGLGCCGSVTRWMTEWPPGSRTHHECHYGFKVHAIAEAARRGATSILWLDSSCHAIKPIEPLWEKIEREGHFLGCGSDLLGTWSSDRCLDQFGITRDEAMKIPLVSGTFIGLNLNNARSRTFIERLTAFATPENFNGTHRAAALSKGSNDPRCEGHRSDEPYMTLLARELGMDVYGNGDLCSGVTDQPSLLIKSGYDLPANGETPLNLETIGEHTVDVNLIGGGLVLDAGSRDFIFSREMARRGCRVIAMDADPTVTDPGIENVAFMNLALADRAGEMEFVMTADPQARHLAPDYAELNGPERVKVKVTTLVDLMDGLAMPLYKVGGWDCIKLDIEGAEMGILQAWPGPVSKQISIEFHEHVKPQPQAAYDAIFKHLGAWYRVVQHNKEARYCCAPNYFDSLLILKEPYLGQVR